DLSCEQQTSCSSCSSQKSCGTGVVTKAIGNKSLSWHLRTEKNVQVGQVVEIGFPESSLIKSAMAVYLLPLFGLILGAMVGH
ncbi:SoxR reducing system RseC family protein, partial [Vibrio parahaemolyticus]|nr:SoxR reducing system RseC family protein [Vibrio parahaemolyticus]MBE3972642.1 SoxR reducing system RseC family protein [Vibrio parahaemolyticus]